MSGARTPALRIGHHLQDGCIVVALSGELTTGSYPRLRDALLTLLAEQPVAVVVDLGGLLVPDPVVLSVFPAVAMVSASPPVPLLLAAATGELRTRLDEGAVPRVVPTYPTVLAALAEAVSMPVRRRQEIYLPCLPSASRQARRWIRECCAEWNLPAGDPLDTVVLVGTELVENVIRHARTATRLRLEQHRSGLTISVSDGSPEPPVLRAPGPGRPVGGLAVVDALATVWGHRAIGPGGAEGKVVWAVLPFPSADPAAGPPPSRVPAAALRAGVARAGIDPYELWLCYVGLGGSLSAGALTAALAGELIAEVDHDRVAHALDEYFDEQGGGDAVPYASS